ncbi:hypothetical protein [Mycetohabitans sp. B46]|uniref:hypothetical protein n=1 Tax=Mycetohabitans sp. B46 TaxID=2772536 RepID=UPI00307CD930
MSARSKTPHGVALGFTRRGAARSGKHVRNTRRIEPRLGPAKTRAANPRSLADSPASDEDACHARQHAAEPVYATARSFDTAPPSFVTPPWTGLQRAPLARRHTAALAALLALGAGALGVTLSQLYQDRAPSEPRRYAEAMSREAPTQSDASASTVPLFDVTALASHTEHLSAQAPQHAIMPPLSLPPSPQARAPASNTASLASIQPARGDNPASMGAGTVQRGLPSTFHARTRKAIASTAQDTDGHTALVTAHAGLQATEPLSIPHEVAHPAQHAVATAAPAEPRQPGADTPGVSRADARAATDALTQDAVTPLPPEAARVDPTQPPVVYGGHTAPSAAAAVPRPTTTTVPYAAEATSPHVPPSAAEATAALTAKAIALPQAVRLAATATRPALAQPPADTGAPASIDDEPAAPIDDQ